MIFKQQITLNSTSNAGTTGTGVVYGFGHNSKTKFSLQATFTNDSNVLTAPSAAEFYLNPGNDGVAFSATKIIDWNTAQTDGDNSQSNGDAFGVSGVGPFDWIKLGWNITWGSATVAVITIIAETESND